MKTNNNPLRIIIADDHDLYRDGFRSLLGKQGDIQLIAEACNGSELLSLTGALNPDVIITDISMPGMNGIEATRILRQKFPDLGIIALSMYNNDLLVSEMLEAGANGYLSKNAGRNEVIEAIHAVSRQEIYYCASTCNSLSSRIANSSLDPLRPLRKQVFTENEINVMKLICQGFQSRQIADKLLYGERTIEGFRSSILAKINAHNTAAIIMYAIKNHIYIP